MRIVPFSGPQPNPVLLLGEGPGGDEVRYLVPFIGKSGKELNGQYLPTSGLSRNDIRVGNVTLTAFPGFRNPELEEAALCASYHLPKELRETNPEYIILLGAVALGVFGGWDMDMVHGRPIENVEAFGWRGPLFPTFHPAAGLRQPRFQKPLRDDFEDLWRWRHGKLQVPADQFPNPDYRELRTPDDLTGVVRDIGLIPGTGLELATDTEYGKDEHGKESMVCLSFSFRPGTGYVIWADNHELLRLYRMLLERVNPLLVFHNYLADEPMYKEAGLPIQRWVDTMMEAYRLSEYSQSLKVLAYRHCGMAMQEYEDLVGPYTRQEAMDYLLRAGTTILRWYIEDLPWKTGKRVCSGAKKYGGRHERTTLLYGAPVTQRCPLCTNVLDAPKMEKDKGGRRFIWDRAAAILTAAEESPKVNPMKRWNDIDEEERAPMELVIGKMPRGSIRQVPKDRVVPYACRDSDATLRLKGPLYRKAAELGRKVRHGT